MSRRRGVWDSGRQRSILGSYALCAELAVLRLQGGGRSFRARIFSDVSPSTLITNCSTTTVPTIPREADSVDPPQCHRRETAAHLRRRRSRARLVYVEDHCEGILKVLQQDGSGSGTTSAPTTSAPTSKSWTGSVRCWRNCSLPRAIQHWRPGAEELRGAQDIRRRPSRA